ncbi:MAG: histidinol-phosphate transaminase [Velocimicrobium sp.]
MQYVHGGDYHKNKGMLDFSANINPLGMPKGCMKEAMRGVLESVHYPDYEGRKLLHALTQSEGVDSHAIILGNGAAELIYAICYAIFPQKALVAVPCFQEYEIALHNVGCQVEHYCLKREMEYQLDEDFLLAITKEIDLVFLCNPNNPTGKLIEKELLTQIVTRCQECNTYLVIDECFLPFVIEEENYSMKAALENNPYLFILRAFTKIYAMPGLRLGYFISLNETMRTKIRSCMQPWNTSIPAQYAGLKALKDQEFIARTRAFIEKERTYLEKRLRLPVIDHVFKGQANFIFFEASKDLYRHLQDKQIIIRDCSNFENLSKGFYRIAILMHKENETLIRAIEEATEYGYEKELLNNGGKE